MPFPRLLVSTLQPLLKKGASLLLLGPRQTGKSTLVQGILEEAEKQIFQLDFRLQETKTYEQLSRRPQSFFETASFELERRDKVDLYIDEVQLIPELLNDCQSLLDRYPQKARVFLTGSSARKLRRAGANLLPGRVLYKHLHPLVTPEYRKVPEQQICPVSVSPTGDFRYPLEDVLTCGTLPGMMQMERPLREEMLRSYVSTYLQEELRAEALVRRIGPFARFLELAALESGTAPNLSKLSQEAGVPLTTLIHYFQVLEDTLVIIRLPAFGIGGRKRVLSTPRYLFFDLGVRNACAGLPLSPDLLKTQGGTLFEQFIILEMIRRIDYAYSGRWRYYFWRTTSQAEVDLVIDTGRGIIPIEIKYATTPREGDVVHLRSFMKTYGCEKGFLVGRFERPERMANGITALPWQWI